MTTDELTKAQANVLEAMRMIAKHGLRERRQRIRGTKWARIPDYALDCYDGRSIEALRRRGLIQTRITGDEWECRVLLT